MARFVGVYKRKLEESGVASNVIADAAEHALAEAQGAGSLSQADAAAGNLILTGSRPPVKKPRKTKDRGPKVLEVPPVDMRYGDPKVRLEWIIKHADHNPNEYNEASRTRIRRHKPIAECYRTCCNSDVEAFLRKHKTVSKTGKDQQFSYAKFKCNDCELRKRAN
jgi:hypothetical protein